MKKRGVGWGGGGGGGGGDFTEKIKGKKIVYLAYYRTHGKVNIYPDDTITTAFNPGGYVDIFRKSNLSKDDAIDAVEFLEKLLVDYLLIVSYSKVYANRYLKNIRFDIRIGKRALVEFYTEPL